MKANYKNESLLTFIQLTQIKGAFEKIVRENMELKKILKGYEIQSGQISPVN